ncbi:uncharacterized protein L969DRAFT_17078 [Mixia osmundae IAM 14324]|uniref:Uncharacterized protein n=1 Tax=Mixia osmundae (strain CBS 9802 / IAM 14324 / JCM 22182 / KY 12970) TaxID=764103 RepID=G7E6F7_MIXOS|nr:uncharacterized protein L969DRAFT_17078 [Mixia osmundae IAM 14324]KEI40426.1 hypothetical protein L969DRAFT_17078 [Mixia osmundae IAM 14324]GAA98417.1 hypothetical protein E5Q_05103 [Mixia osmundae IAM 14324]
MGRSTSLPSSSIRSTVDSEPDSDDSEGASDCDVTSSRSPGWLVSPSLRARRTAVSRSLDHSTPLCLSRRQSLRLATPDLYNEQTHTPRERSGSPSVSPTSTGSLRRLSLASSTSSAASDTLRSRASTLVNCSQAIVWTGKPFAAVGLFEEPMLSSSPPKRVTSPLSAQDPHLQERTKKLKIAHRSIRSPLLLRPPRTSVQASPSGTAQTDVSAARPVSTITNSDTDSWPGLPSLPGADLETKGTTPEWLISSLVRDTPASRLAPAEWRWVGDGYQWLPNASENRSKTHLEVEFARLCKTGATDLSTVTSRRMCASPASIDSEGDCFDEENVTQTLADLHGRRWSEPVGLSMGIPLERRRMQQLPLRHRAASAENLERPPVRTVEEIITLTRSHPPPESTGSLKAQLLSLLRAKTSDGSSPQSRGVAVSHGTGLRMRKWVARNAWSRRLTPQLKANTVLATDRVGETRAAVESLLSLSPDSSSSTRSVERSVPYMPERALLANAAGQAVLPSVVAADELATKPARRPSLSARSHSMPELGKERSHSIKRLTSRFGWRSRRVDKSPPSPSGHEASCQA